MGLERIVVLVGSGAVKNAWEPVRRALLRTYEYVPRGEATKAGRGS